MVIDMNEAQLQTLARIREFMAGTAEVSFKPLTGRQDRYEFVSRALLRLGWACHRRLDKGLLRVRAQTCIGKDCSVRRSAVPE
jgi:hypothetical protein